MDREDMNNVMLDMFLSLRKLELIDFKIHWCPDNTYAPFAEFPDGKAEYIV